MNEIFAELLKELKSRHDIAVIDGEKTKNMELQSLYQGKIEAYNTAMSLVRIKQIAYLTNEKSR